MLRPTGSIARSADWSASRLTGHFFVFYRLAAFQWVDVPVKGLAYQSVDWGRPVHRLVQLCVSHSAKLHFHRTTSGNPPTEWNENIFLESCRSSSKNDVHDSSNNLDAKGTLFVWCTICPELKLMFINFNSWKIIHQTMRGQLMQWLLIARHFTKLEIQHGAAMPWNQPQMYWAASPSRYRPWQHWAASLQTYHDRIELQRIQTDHDLSQPRAPEPTDHYCSEPQDLQATDQNQEMDEDMKAAVDNMEPGESTPRRPWHSRSWSSVSVGFHEPETTSNKDEKEAYGRHYSRCTHWRCLPSFYQQGG